MELLQRLGASISSAGVVMSLPNLPAGVHPGYETMGVVVVGVGISNPSGAVPSGLTIRLESVNAAGTVESTQDVTFGAVAAGSFSTITIAPFYVAIGNMLRVRVQTGVGTGLTADVTVFVKYHGKPVPEQRQVIGVANV
jgi:phage tail sheath gpL-like